MKITKFTKRGQHHQSAKEKNQDAIYSFQNNNISYVAVADGASSCENSKRGAEISCRCIKNLVSQCDIFTFDQDKIAYLILEEIMFHINNEAKALNQSPKTFACTFAFACLNKQTNMLLTFNLGDGSIFVQYDKSQKYQILSAPKRHNGKCTLVPNLNAYKDATVTYTENFSGAVFLCTDGLYSISSEDEPDIEDIIRNADSLNTIDDFSFALLDNYNEVEKF